MRNLVLISSALIIIITSIYWQVGTHDFVNIDDNFLITENIHVTTGLNKENFIWAFSPVRGIGWHPVTWLTHMIDVEFYGLNPRGHHLTNLFFHIAATLCLFIFFYRLSNALWKSAFIALLFAVHPMHVESVAWMAERRDVLSAFFCFMTLWLYVEYVINKKERYYLLSLFAFMLGLMSKPMIVTFPLIMILIDYWPLSRFNIDKSKVTEKKHSHIKSEISFVWIEKIPFIILSIISCVITLNIPSYYDRQVTLIPLILRIENAIISYVVYMFKIVFPVNMSIFYPFNYSIKLWQVTISLLILLLITAGSIIIRKKFPYIFIGWFWFLVTLIPVIGIIQISYYAFADRYTYISYVGLFIIFAYYAEYIADKFKNNVKILLVSAITISILLMYISYNQIKVWKNSVTLFTHALNVTTDNYFAHHSLGLAYDELNNLDEAIAQYKKAISINENVIDQHYNYAAALQKKGLLNDAIIEYRKALFLNPKELDAYNNLGIIYMNKGMFVEALNEFDKAISIDNNYNAAKVNRSFVSRYLDLKNIR